MTLVVQLVRHAPCTPVMDRRYPHPHDDPSLNDAGEILARRLAGVLLPQALAYTSPSLRAHQTGKLAGFSPRIVPALAEANFGVMAGRTWAELEAVYANLPWHWTKALADPTLEFGPPKGETGRAFHARIHEWLLDLPLTGEVVAFTHATVLQAALRLTVQVSGVETPPGCVVTLKREGPEWLLMGLLSPDNLPR